MPFFFGGIYYRDGESPDDEYTQPKRTFVPLADREVAFFDAAKLDVSPGRRLRVFAGLIHAMHPSYGDICLRASHTPFLDHGFPISYSEVYEWVCSDEGKQIHKELGALNLRTKDKGRPLITEIGEFRNEQDPELHAALQDLGDEINEDIREACFAFDDPDLFYPGVDDGIEPVSDDHVKLVVWAMQRELLRELRRPTGEYGQKHEVLPAVTLADLPWRVQRALVERRRLRFSQYGIHHEQWERGKWSLWDVPEDADWVPRRQQRMAAA